MEQIREIFGVSIEFFFFFFFLFIKISIHQKEKVNLPNDGIKNICDNFFLLNSSV